MSFSQEEMYAFLTQIRFEFEKSLTYYRTYEVEVMKLEDGDNFGRVAVGSPQLAASTDTSYILAEVVGSARSFMQPAVGDKGLLFFVNANPSEPRFLSTSQKAFMLDAPEQRKFTLASTPRVNSILDVDEDGGFTLESRSENGKNSITSPSVLGQKLKDLLDYIFDKYLKDIYTRLDEISQQVSQHIHPTGVGPSGAAIAPTPTKMSAVSQNSGSQISDLGSKKAEYAEPGKLLSTTNKNN